MPNKKIKRRPRQNPTTVKQWVDCINQRYRRHRSAILTEDIAFGDWLLDKKQELRTRGDLWGRVFKDRGMECSQATAEKYMSIAGNSVMRDSAHAKIWPRSFYVRYLLSTMPESRLQEVIEAGGIHPKLQRDEAEALLRKRADSASRHRSVTFGRSMNGGVQGDLWHNRLDQIFGTKAVGRKRAPGAHLYEFGKRNLRAPVDILKAMLALSTLLPDDRHWPGDGQPKKWGLLLRFLYEHERVETCLQDLCQRPLEQHEAYIDRLMREAHEAHRAAEGVAAETVGAANADAA
jgi:hypothetical protein